MSKRPGGRLPHVGTSPSTQWLLVAAASEHKANYESIVNDDEGMGHPRERFDGLEDGEVQRSGLELNFTYCRQ
jgi:hypothetical protein